MPQIRCTGASSTFCDCRPTCSVSHIDLMSAKGGLEEQPASKDPSSGFIGLSWHNTRALAGQLPRTILPSSTDERDHKMPQSRLLARGFDTDRQPLNWSDTNGPTMCKQSMHTQRIHANWKPVIRHFNEASRPQHGVLIGLDVLNP